MLRLSTVATLLTALPLAAQMTWIPEPVTGSPPNPRAQVVAVQDTLRQRLVVFGGLQIVPGTQFQDTWEWDGTSWTQRTNGYANGAPVARASATLSWAPPLGGCVLVGGSSPARGIRGDAWLWDGIGWRPLGFGPAVIEHGAARDEARGRLVVHGGYDGRDESPDTWEWDGSSWLPQPPALPVAGPTLVYDPGLGRVLRFGGFQNPGGVVSDLLGLRQTVADQVVTAGAACSASNPAPDLATTSRPLLGASGFALRVTRAGPLLPVIAVLSPSQGSGQVFGNCTVVPDLANAALLFGLSDPSGSATLALPIPFDAALRGATVFHQTVVLVPGGPLNGVGALSNALATTLGD